MVFFNIYDNMTVYTASANNSTRQNMISYFLNPEKNVTKFLGLPLQYLNSLESRFGKI